MSNEEFKLAFFVRRGTRRDVFYALSLRCPTCGKDQPLELLWFAAFDGRWENGSEEAYAIVAERTNRDVQELCRCECRVGSEEEKETSWADGSRREKVYVSIGGRTLVVTEDFYEGGVCTFESLRDAEFMLPLRGNALENA
jgi:hypothetical protein